MKTVIVGAGIAGAALAYWLRRSGHQTTLIEKAPALRRGGYLIDFWGAGFDVAERMGIVPELMRRGIVAERADLVDRHGKRFASLDPALFVRGTQGRYVSIGRGDLAAIVYEAAQGPLPGPPTELVLDDTVQALTQTSDAVRIDLLGGDTLEADLVVGADGLHSVVRGLVFGPAEPVTRELGIAFAAYEIDGYQGTGRGEPTPLAVTMYAEVGRQAVRVTRPDGRTMVLLTFRHEGPVPSHRLDQEALLRERMGGADWEVPDLLAALPTAPALYLDQMAQIQLPAWSKGRVVLVGDAGASVSPLAGQGSALAMVEAYVLAAELDRCHGDHAAAFRDYHDRLRTLIRDKQQAADGLAMIFAPRNRRQLLTRNLLVRLLGLPLASRMAYGSLRDAIELPAPAGG